jgi:hypothetical protein
VLAAAPYSSNTSAAKFWFERCQRSTSVMTYRALGRRFRLQSYFPISSSPVSIVDNRRKGSDSSPPILGSLTPMLWKYWLSRLRIVPDLPSRLVPAPSTCPILPLARRPAARPIPRSRFLIHNETDLTAILSPAHLAHGS